MRPLYHFTPPQNFMNDPNGLVYFGGEWHLFYQHNPFGIEWGHMSWGHAVSGDLVHWEHLPVALYEADGVMIFSGSAAVDWHNSSGFGDGVTPPLIAAYTAHTETEQMQHIAFSVGQSSDRKRGRVWANYAGNPVISIGLKDFRDPKILWHAPTQRWLMVVALADQRRVRFCNSTDLRAWQHLSDFGPAGATDDVWECPDFFALPVDNDRSRQKWILKVDNGPSTDGHSGAQYFIGDFDGVTFNCDDPLDRVRPLDYGADFYAAQSWSDTPNDRRIWIAWMSNWAYANVTPTSPWRGMMTISRQVTLESFADGLRVVQQPVAELKQLRREHHRCADISIEAANTGLIEQSVAGTALEIIVEFEANDARDASEFGLKVRVGAAEETLIGYDSATREVYVDRSCAGDQSFSPRFDDRHAAPVDADTSQLKLHVFVDTCSVEVFVNEGRVVLSELIFPDDAATGLALFGESKIHVKSLDVWRLHE